jgi:hypothetical protein
VNLDSLMGLNTRLAAARHQLPGIDAVHRTADTIAAEANALFTDRKVPLQVAVTRSATGAKLRLVATGRLTKSFGSTTPTQALNRIVAKHWPASATAAAQAELARIIR